MGFAQIFEVTLIFKCILYELKFSTLQRLKSKGMIFKASYANINQYVKIEEQKRPQKDFKKGT